MKYKTIDNISKEYSIVFNDEKKENLFVDN